MLVVAKTPAPDTTPESRNAAHNVAVPASRNHLFFCHGSLDLTKHVTNQMSY